MQLTIFTATYNRAHLLPKLYESLKAQTWKDFEWVIVDDASNDNTEELVQQWRKENLISIVFYKQQHGGKHRAINKGVKLAKGEFFFIVDSDDWLPKNSLSIAIRYINDVKDIDDIAGVSGLRKTQKEILGGTPVVSDKGYIDANNFERKKYNLLGDKAEIYKTSLLKRFPFPEFSNEFFVTEDVCWNAIANAGYKIRWFNEVIYCCEYLDDGLTKSGSNELRGHLDNFQGFNYYIKKLIEYQGLINNPRILLSYLTVIKRKQISVQEMATLLDITLFKCYLFPIFIVIGLAKSFCLKVLRYILSGGKKK